MARPRIFISSTHYDLKYIREDLDAFIRNLGYEPIRHETGSIPYGSAEAPEKYAYKEVSLCDILVCIVGGRFGTESRDGGASITQTELRHALDRGIQVFILIDHAVHTEHQTYLLNKENGETKYRFADDPRVYQFIEQLQALPCNNPIQTFLTSKDIIAYLKDQWAGLFQRFLTEQRRVEEINVLNETKVLAATLSQIVDRISSTNRETDPIISDILRANHPAFRSLAKLLKVSYRVFFTNSSELENWLSARKYKPVNPEAYDDDSFEEWVNEKDGFYLKIREQIFDKDKNLKTYSDDEWKDDWIILRKIAKPEDEDIPF